MPVLALRAAFAALATTALLAAPARAEQDFIVTTGPMTNDDFYRLVSCRAAPGGECALPIVHWPAHTAADLTVGIEPISHEYPKPLSKVMVRALEDAIRALNASGANLNLRRVGPGEFPRIRLILTPAGDGEPIQGTGVRDIDGTIIGAGLTTIWWNDRLEITRGIIVMADDLPEREVYPVMLEELTQTMGLLTDVRNPYYNAISVFSEDSNSVYEFGPQDLMVLRRHYP